MQVCLCLCMLKWWSQSEFKIEEKYRECTLNFVAKCDAHLINSLRRLANYNVNTEDKWGERDEAEKVSKMKTTAKLCEPKVSSMFDDASH